ncbi:undecaprenyldiphospho-muramoylpentapeptide beta-N-acetylglucosaminyltransferase [Pseudodesulfovibrio sp. zrk46]|uniref:undecaprenyldiphospho-muramoylpentapeptide beta-N-acetylglucosaminyltransferase n=1 Tax=Pseudodesulfovibrio sp. zrk46 TaxID=2725288 RepID=UPI0014491481|nr:undecaprenyldiphospho-muramoylpentapeptide beta-N-acetylglucosaminyltransferase [Pseudodesulfovibrio sp. zrk46]QJB55399.1 undecaprenyldiphospho-muramoylpentapeptide beta-N-acetylglucosaminyltransferase [Pseudodesulfovibrio sp. zrk46]
MNVLNRVILTTGGTGGHIFPALAVADELRRRNPNVDILFIGGSGPEGKLADKHKIRFRELPARGIMGLGLKGILGGIGWLGKAIPQARTIVKEFNPDVVIGFGGYAGFCPVLGAAMSGFPTAVHEQNSVPGVTNKVLGRFVKRVFLSFPDTSKAFPKRKTMLTGNPVRKNIMNICPMRLGDHTDKYLLILGGSQGARPINDAVIEALPMFMEAGIKIVHQAGRADVERVQAAYKEAGADPAQVRGFIDDMAGEYARADLAICRSGASTVFEIAAAGVPAIFVPFPQATHDHQTMNAKALSDNGAAMLLPQNQMTGKKLGTMALELLENDEKRLDLGSVARMYARRRAAAHIVTGLEALVA